MQPANRPVGEGGARKTAEKSLTKADLIAGRGAIKQPIRYSVITVMNIIADVTVFRKSANQKEDIKIVLEF